MYNFAAKSLFHTNGNVVSSRLRIASCRRRRTRCWRTRTRSCGGCRRCLLRCRLILRPWRLVLLAIMCFNYCDVLGDYHFIFRPKSSSRALQTWRTWPEDTRSSRVWPPIGSPEPRFLYQCDAPYPSTKNIHYCLG